ncbi:hypothetical protein [Runella sp.]|jgi:hypothetical protein|uniref:hypothetical protein n=1 Tax=Runella sp. TaxID=1960881 RepID=UPI0026018936|nr:hypothetical protein [Runella sp.]
MEKLFYTLIVILVGTVVHAQVPQRKAFMGMQGKETPDGIVIDTVFANSTFAAANLKKGINSFCSMTKAP